MSKAQEKKAAAKAFNDKREQDAIDRAERVAARILYEKTPLGKKQARDRRLKFQQLQALAAMAYID